MDLSMRTNLLGVLGSCGTKFSANILMNECVGKLKKSVKAEFIFSSDSIRLLLNNESIKFKYSLDRMQVVINVFDISKLALLFDSRNHEDSELVIALKAFLSRNNVVAIMSRVD
jgi:hypothetical protein